ncbi:MAG: JAB domain-containing protein, partial [Oscillospiraceae bacterium]|nr:JAB domain-containing protein [Oscillospiraceae bacterium]
TLTSSRLIVDYLSPLFFGARDENFYAVYLDAQCTVITCRLLSSGSANSTPVDIRKVVELALECNATSIVVAHNHTTSSSEPSQADLDTTFRLRSALTPLGIFLLDHIIFSTVDWLSMHDNGILD